jgi:hypothetical protein
MEFQGRINPAQQPDKHIGIFPELIHPLGSHRVSFEDAQFHRCPVQVLPIVPGPSRPLYK